jgi:hypothetical protein
MSSPRARRGFGTIPRPPPLAMKSPARTPGSSRERASRRPWPHAIHRSAGWPLRASRPHVKSAAGRAGLAPSAGATVGSRSSGQPDGVEQHHAKAGVDDVVGVWVFGDPFGGARLDLLGLLEQLVARPGKLERSARSSRTSRRYRKPPRASGAPPRKGAPLGRRPRRRAAPPRRASRPGSPRAQRARRSVRHSSACVISCDAPAPETDTGRPSDPRVGWVYPHARRAPRSPAP